MKKIRHVDRLYRLVTGTNFQNRKSSKSTASPWSWKQVKEMADACHVPTVSGTGCLEENAKRLSNWLARRLEIFGEVYLDHVCFLPFNADPLSICRELCLRLKKEGYSATVRHGFVRLNTLISEAYEADRGVTSMQNVRHCWVESDDFSGLVVMDALLEKFVEDVTHPPTIRSLRTFDDDLYDVPVFYGNYETLGHSWTFSPT